MDTITILQDLNRRFAQPLPEFYARRVIFWYDEDREFEDSIGELQLENAKVLNISKKFLELMVCNGIMYLVTKGILVL